MKESSLLFLIIVVVHTTCVTAKDGAANSTAVIETTTVTSINANSSFSNQTLIKKTANETLKSDAQSPNAYRRNPTPPGVAGIPILGPFLGPVLGSLSSARQGGAYSPETLAAARQRAAQPGAGLNPFGILNIDNFIPGGGAANNAARQRLANQNRGGLFGQPQSPVQNNEIANEDSDENQPEEQADGQGDSQGGQEGQDPNQDPDIQQFQNLKGSNFPADLFPPGVLSPQDLADIQKGIEEQQKREAEKQKQQEAEQEQPEDESNEGNEDSTEGEEAEKDAAKDTKDDTPQTGNERDAIGDKRNLKSPYETQPPIQPPIQPLTPSPIHPQSPYPGLPPLTPPDPRLGDALNDPRIRDVISNPRFRTLINDPRIRNQIRDPRLREIVSNQGIRDAINDPRLRDVISNPGIRDVTSDPRLRDLVSNPRIRDAINDPRIRDAITDARYRDAIGDPRLRDVYSGQRQTTRNPYPDYDYERPQPRRRRPGVSYGNEEPNNYNNYDRLGDRRLPPRSRVEDNAYRYPRRDEYSPLPRSGAERSRSRIRFDDDDEVNAYPRLPRRPVVEGSVDRDYNRRREDSLHQRGLPRDDPRRYRTEFGNQGQYSNSNTALTSGVSYDDDKSINETLPVYQPVSYSSGINSLPHFLSNLNNSQNTRPRFDNIAPGVEYIPRKQRVNFANRNQNPNNQRLADNYGTRNIQQNQASRSKPFVPPYSPRSQAVSNFPESQSGHQHPDDNHNLNHGSRHSNQPSNTQPENNAQFGQFGPATPPAFLPFDPSYEKFLSNRNYNRNPQLQQNPNTDKGGSSVEYDSENNVNSEISSPVNTGNAATRNYNTPNNRNGRFVSSSTTSKEPQRSVKPFLNA